MSRKNRTPPIARGVLTVLLLGGCAGADPPTEPSAEAPPAKLCPDALPATCATPMPSYQADVAPLITRSCVRCHDHDQGACAHSLLDYPAVFANRAAMTDHIYNCTMPPVSEPALSDPERALLLAWLVCGAPNN